MLTQNQPAVRASAIDEWGGGSAGWTGYTVACRLLVLWRPGWDEAEAVSGKLIIPLAAHHSSEARDIRLLDEE